MHSSFHFSIFPEAYSKYCVLLYLDGDISSVVSSGSKVCDQKFSPLLVGKLHQFCLLTTIKILNIGTPENLAVLS